MLVMYSASFACIEGWMVYEIECTECAKNLAERKGERGRHTCGFRCLHVSFAGELCIRSRKQCKNYVDTNR